MKSSRLHGALACFGVVSAMLAGTLAIAGCSAGAKGGQIEARTWHVLAFTNASGNLVDSPLTVPLDARYEGGKVSGSAGCSTFTGSYTVSGENLSVTGIEVVKGSCDQIAMTADATYMAALPRVATFRVDGPELSVYDGAGKEILHCRDEQAFQNQ